MASASWYFATAASSAPSATRSTAASKISYLSAIAASCVAQLRTWRQGGRRLVCDDAWLERGARVDDPSLAPRFAAGEEVCVLGERFRRPRRGRSLRVVHAGHALHRRPRPPHLVPRLCVD